MLSKLFLLNLNTIGTLACLYIVLAVISALLVTKKREVKIDRRLSECSRSSMHSRFEGSIRKHSTANEASERAQY